MVSLSTPNVQVSHSQAQKLKGYHESLCFFKFFKSLARDSHNKTLHSAVATDATLYPRQERQRGQQREVWTEPREVGKAASLKTFIWGTLFSRQKGNSEIFILCGTSFILIYYTLREEKDRMISLK